MDQGSRAARIKLFRQDQTGAVEFSSAMKNGEYELT